MSSSKSRLLLPIENYFLFKSRSIFQEIVSMDTLIVHIMNQAQKLVNADRASLFLVDNRRKELYARWVQKVAIYQLSFPPLIEYLTFHSILNANPLPTKKSGFL